MPTYMVAGPDGKKYKVTGDSPEGAVAALKKMLAETPEAETVDPSRIDQSFGVANERENPPEMRAATTTIGDRVYDFAKSIGLGPTARSMRQGNQAINAAVEGASQGLTFGFSDEAIAALRAIGPSTYAEEIKKERARMNFNKRSSPKASAAGEIIGALGLGMGANKAGLSLIDRMKLASLPKRALAGVIEGAAYGGAYGLGTGEGLEGKLQGYASGTLFGAGLGGAIPVVGTSLAKGGNAIADAMASRWRAIASPEKAAFRKVAEVTEGTGVNISPWDEAVATRHGLPILNIDRGGTGARELGRAALNKNPEAQNVLEKMVSERYESQGSRGRSVIDYVMGGQVDDVALKDAIKIEARKANKPRYDKAYAQGENLTMTPEMERLTSSPTVVAAMKKVATGSGQDRAVAEGAGSFNPGVTVTPDGRIVFQSRGGSNNAFPNLKFWDYVKQELDDMATSLRGRDGRQKEAAAVEEITRQLVKELDGQVPSYAKARKGAAEFFAADDALEAGQQFAKNDNIDLRRAISTMGRFTPEELMAFRVGFAGQLREATKKGGPVAEKLFKSERAKEKIRAALGQDGYAEFETWHRLERQMDFVRGAIKGNSTTVRQIIQAIGAGSVGGYATNWDPLSMAASAAVPRISGAIAAKASDKMMKKIAEILLSDDPQMLAEGAKMLAKTQRNRKAVEEFGKRLEQIGFAPAASQTAD